MRRVVAVVLAAGLALSGCGFLRSGDRGSNKPDGFVLRGYVSVGVKANATASGSGPAGASGLAGSTGATAGASGPAGSAGASAPAGGPAGSASAPAGDGGPCTAPPAADDVRAGGAVRVADRDGHTLATGSLAPGVTEAGRCNFAFQIAAVPGGVDEYVIGVGNRPSVDFPARDLRSDKPAVIVVDV